MGESLVCGAHVGSTSNEHAVTASAVAATVDDVVDSVLGWLDAGKRVATATVIRTRRSAPRPTGSQLAVNDDLAFVGSVSSGCVETATLRTALDVMADGRARRLSFGAPSDPVFDVGLPCGGDIDLYVECMTHERCLFELLRKASASRRSLVVATDLGSRRRVLLSMRGEHSKGPDGELSEAAREAALRDGSALVDVGGSEWFLQVRHPPRRLVIVGAVHVAQALVPMAILNGFHVVLVDPRPAFLTPGRFQNVDVVDGWPHEVMGELGIDHRTAVVTLAHDPKLDDPALVFAARSPAFYVGALGSRRAHEARLERLSAQGLSKEHRARIRGPVGLPIGALTVSEIATSIVAEMVQTLRGAAR